MIVTLKGKNAIITGARRGIGRAAVEVFAENGANVWACSKTKNIDFEQDMDKISYKYNVWIKPVYFDLLEEEQTKLSIKSILSEKKPVDILVNNAGILEIATFQMTSIKKMKEIFQINFFSQILIMQIISRTMMKQNHGTIVNVSSVAGLDGEKAVLSYGTSKAAIAQATRIVAKDLAEYGIRVNAVAPSYVQTDMSNQLPEIAKKSMLERAGLKQAATPKEVADVITYLCSEKASFITGQIIRVDGGL